MAWWRYIDDVFIIWTGTQEELTIFHTFLNNLDDDIKFTLNSSTTNVQFLDTNVTKMGTQLSTSIYMKPTDKKNLLRYNSAHPRNMIKSLPYSQLLRVKRIVSNLGELQPALNDMENKFLQRGYPHTYPTT